jgi:hypothetical protein
MFWEMLGSHSFVDLDMQWATLLVVKCVGWSQDCISGWLKEAPDWFMHAECLCDECAVEFRAAFVFVKDVLDAWLLQHAGPADWLARWMECFESHDTRTACIMEEAALRWFSIGCLPQKTFACTRFLAADLKVAPSSRRFHCEICPAAFSSRGTYAAHMRAHWSCRVQWRVLPCPDVVMCQRCSCPAVVSIYVDSVWADCSWNSTDAVCQSRQLVFPGDAHVFFHAHGHACARGASEA